MLNVIIIFVVALFGIVLTKKRFKANIEKDLHKKVFKFKWYRKAYFILDEIATVGIIWGATTYICILFITPKFFMAHTDLTIKIMNINTILMSLGGCALVLLLSLKYLNFTIHPQATKQLFNLAKNKLGHRKNQPNESSASNQEKLTREFYRSKNK